MPTVPKCGMKAEERGILDQLDTVLRDETVRAQIAPVIERVRFELARNREPVMAWEPLPLTVIGDRLPDSIRSSWVFVLRHGTNTGPERHPNSHQRMMCYEGAGDMQVRGDENSEWQSNLLKPDRDLPLEERWISIPPNTWHQPVVNAAADWVVVSFHTVAADELIEERPDETASGGTKQTHYVTTL